jgi:hypothetical protein
VILTDYYCCLPLSLPNKRQSNTYVHFFAQISNFVLFFVNRDICWPKYWLFMRRIRLQYFVISPHPVRSQYLLYITILVTLVNKFRQVFRRSRDKHIIEAYPIIVYLSDIVFTCSCVHIAEDSFELSWKIVVENLLRGEHFPTEYMYYSNTYFTGFHTSLLVCLLHFCKIVASLISTRVSSLFILLNIKRIKKY